MKKLIFISFAIIALMAVSCTDDYTDPAKLSGTTWRCSTFTDASMTEEFDYYEFKFTSTTALEVWTKAKNASAEKVQNSYGYTISGKTITITYGDISDTGTIDKTSMTVTSDGITLVFTKL
jgi:hypothetical protein